MTVMEKARAYDEVIAAIRAMADTANVLQHGDIGGAPAGNTIWLPERGLYDRVEAFAYQEIG